MAYSCVRVQFEVGHEASIRNKRTSTGFTHDWEVYVRGADNAEIQHFVEKVVFHLHETFPKPKRIIKEPPYVVKESGYAGFNLPIDIYVKTKEEGYRKIRLFYDLTLQPIATGPARISKLIREKHDFANPTEDLRRKLIRGGGCGVGSDGSTSTEKISSTSGSNNVSNSNNSSNHLDDSKSSPHSSSKGKGGSAGGEPPAKKHKAAKEPKAEESRLTNSFAELFGTPIKTVKHSPNPKPPPKSAGESKPHDKSKEPSSKVPKHSPVKDKERDKSDKERDRREKESEKSSSKEKDRSSKDKDSHKGEGGSERSKDKSSRKSGTSSSSLFSQKDFVKKEDDRGKKVQEEVSSVKEKDKSCLKGDSAASKSEKKHEEKKNREDKEKKEKHKKEIHEKKEVKEGEKEKTVEKRNEVVKETAKEVKEVKHKVDKEEKKSKSGEKSKEKNASEPDKPPKHKHKKKDKHRKDEEREKSKKKDKEKEVLVSSGSIGQDVPKGGKGGSSVPPTLTIIKERISPPSSPLPPPISKSSNNPLNQLIAELSDKDTDSDFSGSEDVVKTEPIEREQSPPPAPAPAPPPLPPVKIKEEKKADLTPKEERPEKSKKRDRKGKDDDHRKRKRKHKDRDSSREEPQDKTPKLSSETVIKDEKLSPSISDDDRSRSASPEETLFTEDYINQLKDLQQKIMTLQDNADLQKVVQVISETGQFEITQRTFDFDLCALDPSTVKMLQDMFISA